MILAKGSTIQHTPTGIKKTVYHISKDDKGEVLVYLSKYRNKPEDAIDYKDIVQFYKILVDGRTRDITGYAIPAPEIYKEEEAEVKKDTKTDSSSVDHPSHYNQGKQECIDIMEETFGKDAVLQFSICNAFKYLYRCKHKDAMLQDLEKAKWYIEKAIRVISNQTPIV